MLTLIQIKMNSEVLTTSAFEVKNILGHTIVRSLELIALNNLILLLVMIMSVVTLIHKLHEDMSDREEILCKGKYIGFFGCAALGLFYPIVWGLLGMNFLILVELVFERLAGTKWYTKFFK